MQTDQIGMPIFIYSLNRQYDIVEANRPTQGTKYTVQFRCPLNLKWNIMLQNSNNFKFLSVHLKVKQIEIFPMEYESYIN